MYKFLLCWRYLRTRYIALASIVSVMLGVATMIVVNSVMAGFSNEMQERIHGIHSDISFESRSMDGMRDPDWHMEQIRKVAGDEIEGMTATVMVPAMLTVRRGGEDMHMQVQVFGIDEKTYSEVSDFSKYLQHPQNRRHASFELREGGYDYLPGTETPSRPQMKDAGWTRRRAMARLASEVPLQEAPNGAAAPVGPMHQDPYGPPAEPSTLTIVPPAEPIGERPAQPLDTSLYDRAAGLAESPAAGGPRLVVPTAPVSPSSPSTAYSTAPTAAWPPWTTPGAGGPASGGMAHAGPGRPPLVDPMADYGAESNAFDPSRETHAGIVLGIGLVGARRTLDDGTCEELLLALPGDDVILTMPTTGSPPKPVSDRFTVIDIYESRMSYFDSSCVFVPIRRLQEVLGMLEPGADPNTTVGYVSAIQIKLREGADAAAVRDKLRAKFPPQAYRISTWRDKQSVLLAAVEMETQILNVLLFLIIAVAGFGILAIFLMIVVEKTRDIGILKSLGASRQGVMGIFLAYGLSLGLVGSGVGLVLGLVFVRYINEIADLLSKIRGQPVFDPSVYYFYKIPTIVSTFTVSWIMAGAIAIAVLASVLPALNAARLHPVEALRYE